jgi:hypothetical protein
LRLFQSGGVSAWPVFGSNRILRDEAEKGNRIPVDHVEYRFSYRWKIDAAKNAYRFSLMKWLA